MRYIIPILVVLFTLPNIIYSQEISDVQIEAFFESLKGVLNKVSSNITLSDDVGLNISQYLTKYGYPSESYEVITDDGYIINLQRVPAGKSQEIVTTANTTKPAALFVHGLFCSAIDWVTLGPNNSLALLMADLGYDVWLLNTRGNRYSINHQTLNASDAAFWDFSFHEKGYYDIAASIDHILSITSLDKITLIGHSEGASSSMALTTTRTEYNNKLNLMVFLSPVGYMGGVRSPLPLLMAKYMTELQAVVNILKIHALPYTEIVSKAIIDLAKLGMLEEFSKIIQMLCGDDADQMDMDYLMLFLADKPEGTSVKQLAHYGQEMRAASFRQYDYGTLENLIHYGFADPPIYDPSKITAPVAAYYAQNDLFAGVSDVEKLLDQMPNKADVYLVEYEKFNHLDFISAKDAKTLLYDRVLQAIEKYNPVK